MSYLMDYGPDHPPAPAADERPGFPPMPLWKKVVAYAIIPTVCMWVIGEACLYLRDHTELTRPTSHSQSTPQR